MSHSTNIPLLMVIALGPLGLISCSFNFELTSQRTALENQIMGNYRELDDDLIVANYDRPSSKNTANERLDRTNLEIEKANKNRAFNADDIDELKDQRILGEDGDSLLAFLPIGIGDLASASPDQVKLAEVLIDEENRDRSVIWNATIAQNPEMSQKDLPSIRKEFGRKIYEAAPKGHWFNTGKKWTPKP